MSVERLNKITKEEIQKHLESGKSVRKIASMYNVNHNTLYMRIKKFGIQYQKRTEVLSPIPFKLSDALIEKYYEDCPINVERIATEEGYEIIFTKDFKNNLSGMYVPPNQLYINSNHSVQRQRFTLAHELGHALLNKEDGNAPKKHESVGFRVESSYTEEDMKKERAANMFAANLLMPASYIYRDVKRNAIITEDVIEELAEKYNVSQAAMCIRLNILGYK